MADDFGDLSDILPQQASVESRFEDELGGTKVAYRFAFIGSGQAGGNIVKSFHDRGYRRVCAVNSTSQDLDQLNLPIDCKFNMGGKGAGKDRSVGRDLAKSKREDIYDMMSRKWGDKVDYAFVCFSAGGGTGAGSFSEIANIARRYMADRGNKVRVGAVVALPKKVEGDRAFRNACDSIDELKSLGLSPVIVVENDRIEKIYPNLSASAFFVKANTAVSRLLHLFNVLAAKSSDTRTFDPADLAAVLDSGVVSMGLTPMASCADKTDVSSAIRTQLESTVLAAVDLKTGTTAGLVFLLGELEMATTPSSVLDHGFEMLGHVLSPDVTVYGGVYPQDSPGVVIATIIGGLAWPGGKGSGESAQQA